MLAGLTALLLQNLMDFNLEFPATSIPACLLMGVLVSRAAESLAAESAAQHS